MQKRKEVRKVRKLSKRLSRNSWAWLLILVLALLLTMPQAVIAGTTDSITITATGAEINIRINTTAWNVGYVYVDTLYNTGNLDSAAWATLENLGGEAVDVTIGGHSMFDVEDDDTWALSNDGTNGADTIGMYAGLNDGDDTFDIIIKNVEETLNQLVNELAASGTQEFGLQFESPTSMSTYELMEMGGGATGAGGAHDDSPRGIFFTGSVD